MRDASKAERIKSFLDRLLAAPAQDSASAALELLRRTLNAVEDELTDIPFDPEHWETDGRLYPPRDDAARAVDDRPDVTRYRSRGHNTFIAANGAIEIQDLNDEVVLVKPGANGEGVWT